MLQVSRFLLAKVKVSTNTKSSHNQGTTSKGLPVLAAESNFRLGSVVAWLIGIVTQRGSSEVTSRSLFSVRNVGISRSISGRTVGNGDKEKGAESKVFEGQLHSCVCVLMSVHVHKGPDFIVVGHVDSLDWLDEVCVDVH